MSGYSSDRLLRGGRRTDPRMAVSGSENHPCFPEFMFATEPSFKLQATLRNEFQVRDHCFGDIRRVNPVMFMSRNPGVSGGSRLGSRKSVSNL